MNRRRTIWTTCAAAAVLTLAGCADLIGGSSAEPSGPAEPSASAGPADPATIAERAAYYGVVPEQVLTVDVEGLTAISHAGGAYGADGYSAVFSDVAAGDAVMLSAMTGEISAQTCPDLPVHTADSTSEGPVGCTVDGEAFHRTAGEAQEYAVQRDDAVVRVSGTGVDPEVLRAALESVRVPTAEELDTLLPPAPSSTASSSPGSGTGDGAPGTGTDGGVEGPVERGDLPPGDGAPDNSVGVGG